MKSEIVPHTRETIGRPKTRFFVGLSMFWCSISLMGMFLWLGLSSVESETTPSVSGSWWNGVSEDNPIIWLLVAPLPIFVLFAIYFRFTEKTRRVVRHGPETEGPIIH